MRLQTTVGDRVDAVLALDHVGGLIQQTLDDLLFEFFLVLVVARFTLRVIKLDCETGFLGAAGIDRGAQIMIGNEHVEWFVLDLEFRNPFGSSRFGFGGHRGNQSTLCLDF